MPGKTSLPRYSVKQYARPDTEIFYESSFDASNRIIFAVVDDDLPQMKGKTSVYGNLYSVDDGLGSTTLQDLRSPDPSGSWNYTAGGALISITTDGAIELDVTPLLQSTFGVGSVTQLTQDQSVTDTFSYAIQMPDGTLSWSTVTYTVQGEGAPPPPPPPPAPVANADFFAVTEQTNALLDLLSNDTASSSLTLLSLSNLTLATTVSVPASFNIYATLNWDPIAATFFGENQFDWLPKDRTADLEFDYRIQDGAGQEAVGYATVTITGLNDPAVIDVTYPNGSTVTEGSTQALTGQTWIRDPDAGEQYFSNFVATSVYGAFSLVYVDEGDVFNWSYTPDPTSPAWASLDPGAQATESVTMTSWDQETVRVIEVVVIGAAPSSDILV